jgi:membrane-associated protein
MGAIGFNGSAAVLEAIVDLVSGSPWTYALIFAVSALDAIVPIVPSETSVIAAGVLAADGDLNIGLVIACAAAGAIAGDNGSYTIGRTVGEWAAEKFFAGKRRRHLDRAERMLDERGGYLIVVARFIPGGRTAATLAAGTLGMPWRRFIVYDVIAGVIWANYAALLGYFGGKAFEDDPLKGFLLAFAIASAIALGVEVYRWLRKRQRTAEA